MLKSSLLFMATLAASTVVVTAPAVVVIATLGSTMAPFRLTCRVVETFLASTVVALPVALPQLTPVAAFDVAG